jgi:cytochrome c553
MNHSTSLIATLSVMALAAVAAAQVQTTAPGGNDAGAGKQIAASGAPNGVAPCMSCHGAQGEGNAASNFPRIAGQPQAYLARQLRSYANGSRDNAVMGPIAKGLTPQQIDAVSAYYAALAAPSPKKPAPQAADKNRKRGEALASMGDEKIGVQGCANCHGPGGVGEPPNYPYLASQHMGYLNAALVEWKSGARKTDPSQQMNLIAKRLSDDDIAAVSSYYATQPAPPPAALRMNVPAGSAARPAAPGGGPSGQPSVPTQGIGTEQGAPTTGGGQGPGGGGGASGSGPSGSPKGNPP